MLKDDLLELLKIDKTFFPDTVLYPLWNKSVLNSGTA